MYRVGYRCACVGGGGGGAVLGVGFRSLCMVVRLLVE